MEAGVGFGRYRFVASTGQLWSGDREVRLTPLAGQFDDAHEWAHKATRVPNCHYWPFAHRVSALGHLQNTGGIGAGQIRAPPATAGVLVRVR